MTRTLRSAARTPAGSLPRTAPEAARTGVSAGNQRVAPATAATMTTIPAVIVGPRQPGHEPRCTVPTGCKLFSWRRIVSACGRSFALDSISVLDEPEISREDARAFYASCTFKPGGARETIE